MSKWIELEEQHGSGAYGNWPIALERGVGCTVWDTENKQYLELGSGIGVTALGHSHPAITEAITDQAGKMLHCINGYFAHPVRAQFLEKLSSIAPGDLNNAFICNSGTEAVEAAIKLARHHTGRGKIISAIRAFHGRTLGALTATWRKDIREPFKPLVPDFEHIAFGRIEALEKALTPDTAAVILEPIQGEGGIIIPPIDYLTRVKEACERNGTLLILDEIQTGIGRTGKWFAAEHFNVVPDIICVAKMLGGGIPIGAMIHRDGLSFERGKHGSTFGGNILACRSALAVLDFIEKNDLLDHALHLGKWALSELQQRTAGNHNVKEVRGLGLMIAIETRGSASIYLKEMLHKGVIAVTAGKKNIRLLPPLIIRKDELQEGIDIILEVLQ